jgi:two-component system, NtrC family, nitrogen regulation response regulator GlnG
VRIIAATHRDLRQLINQGLFREDLFFRLNVVPLRLPPLRERTEDIPDLVRHFLETSTREGLPRKEISPEAFEILKLQRWPGNVRELENLVKRLMAIEVDEIISKSSVEREFAGNLTSDNNFQHAAQPESLSDFIEQHLAGYFASFGKELPPDGLYERIVAEIEPALLRTALLATHGNQLKAADLLGINRNTLRSKLKMRDIKPLRGFS